MCGIYMITNNLNGKKYIGKSIDLKRRLASHKIDTFNPKSAEYSTTIHKAIRKYGLDNFTFSILEECLEKDLASREIYWIKEYGTYGKGYNMTLGGEGKAKIDQEKVIQLWLEGLSISDISEILKHGRPSIIKILRNHHSYSREESLRRGYKKAGIVNGKVICQYDLNSKLISKYTSISEASRKTGITMFCIKESLNNHKILSNNSIWEYENNILNINTYTPIKNLIRPIEQLTLNGDYISEYESLTAAATAVGAKYVQAIKVACNDISKTAYGYKWRYKNSH